MKTAVIHDWLTTYAGSEQVLSQILACYPQSDLFCVVDFLKDQQRAAILGKKAKTTFIQRLPFAKHKYRTYLPLMPMAVKGLDLRCYDLILSSSHAVAKGVKTRPDQLHISYIHSPMRYAWDLQEQYLKETGLDSGIKGWVVRRMLKRIREWDLKNTARVQHLIANSKYIAQRIRNCYGRDSTVIYPPVAVEEFAGEVPREDFYITVSRFVPYKKVDLVAAAFSEMPDKKLMIVGDGPDLRKIQQYAGSNVRLMGALPFSEMKNLLQKAKAFVFAAEEDFGISVVEAQAAGTPVIAFGKGGALETVRGPEQSNPTGIFFDQQEVASLQSVIRAFESDPQAFTPENCRANAQNFTIAKFRAAYTDFVNSQWAEFQNHRHSSLK